MSEINQPNPDHVSDDFFLQYTDVEIDLRRKIVAQGGKPSDWKNRASILLQEMENVFEFLEEDIPLPGNLRKPQILLAEAEQLLTESIGE